MSRRRAVMPAVEDVHGADLSVVDVVTNDAPGVPPVPAGRLDQVHAQALTERIRLTASTIRERWDRLVQLVEQAKAGDAWDVLGYASWTAYLSDVLGGQMRLAGPERAEWVGYLTGQGMSTRAIAPIVGASPKTVARDAAAQREASPEAPTPVVTGRDGKTYLKPDPVVWPKLDGWARDPGSRERRCKRDGYCADTPEAMVEHEESRHRKHAQQPTVPGTEPERMVPTLPGLGVAVREAPPSLDTWVDLPRRWPKVQTVFVGTTMDGLRRVYGDAYRRRESVSFALSEVQESARRECAEQLRRHAAHGDAHHLRMAYLAAEVDGRVMRALAQGLVRQSA